MISKTGEYEVNKSRFCYFRVDGNKEDFELAMKDIERQHKKATHICYAFSFSHPFEEKACDAGEPKGTAGAPILSVIQKKKLTDVAVIVVRYFGGVKLGAGGLVRAYTKSASLALGGEDDNH